MANTHVLDAFKVTYKIDEKENTLVVPADTSERACNSIINFAKWLYPTAHLTIVRYEKSDQILLDEANFYVSLLTKEIPVVEQEETW